MTNLEAAIIAKEAQVKKLLTELEALKKAQAILDGSAETPSERPIRRRRRTGSTLADKVVEILREAGNPMHVDSILPKLSEAGFNSTKPTVVSALLKDRDRRFKALGNNVYELNEIPAEATQDARAMLFGNENGANGEASSNGHQSRFPLLQEVKSAVDAIDGEITQHAVYEWLRTKHPDATTLHPASVASALRRLTEAGQLRVIREKVGGAKVYTKAVEDVTVAGN